MHPWYRGFKGTKRVLLTHYIGTTSQMPKGGYRLTGVIRKLDAVTVEITELPLRSWTQSYKEQLEEWLTGTPKVPAWISDYKEHHTDSRVHFIVTLNSEAEMARAEAEGLEKRFKLSTTIATSNLVCFDMQGRIRKYENVDIILREFYDLRLKYYQRRKDYMLEQLTTEWEKLENKVRFITEIIEGKLVVSNRKKPDLLKELNKRGYAAFSKGKAKNVSEEDEAEEEESGSGYDYLFSMSIWYVDSFPLIAPRNLTMEKVEKLVKEKTEKQAELEALSKQSAKDLWRTDLDAFLVKFEVCFE